MTEPVFGTPTDCGQAELRGLLVGDGTPLKLVGFNPWAATVRADHEEPLSQADGSYSGREYADVKQVPLRLYADKMKNDPEAFWTLQQEILKAFAPSDVDLPLRFWHHGKVFRMLGRPRVVEPDADRMQRGRLMVECGFVALDPRVYADAETSRSLLLPSDSGGVTLPFTLPITIAATFTTGRVFITNEGTAESPWRGVVHGPVTNPRLVNFTTGQELRIGVTVPAGRFLDLDSSTRSVLLDGTASRRGTVSGQWWQLQPGANDIGWFSDIGSDTALLEILFRSAWR